MATVADPLARTEATTLKRMRAVPYLLGAFFVVSSLWGVNHTDVIDTDAARHAMNGAFIYDMVRTGNLTHPFDYAQQYYGHLPALSMPYHPPLFPAIEALFFALFGVKLFAARLVVALSAGACAVLLFRLIERTFGNPVLATCATFSTLWLWTSQQVGRDVMLEYPSMAFALAALLCLGDLGKDLSLGRAIWFAVFASAAFWSKQHTAFLAGLVFLYPILGGRWRWLLRAPVVVSIILFGASIGAYILLSHRFHNAGIHGAATSTSDLQYIAHATLPAYFSWIVADLSGVPGVFGAGALVLYAITRRRRRGPPSFKLALYWAWLISTALVLVDLGATSNRYLFFLCPATIAIGYAWLYQGCGRLWGERAANLTVCGVALVWLVYGFFYPREFLHGPGEAAKAIVQGQPTRILYAGEADGNFIFAVRVLDPSLQVTVIPAAKLPASTFQPQELETFCRKYGVNWVVLENAVIRHSWSSLKDAMPPSLKLDRTIPLESSRSRWRTGSIDLYRVQGVSESPGGILKLPVWRLGGNIAVHL
jgi:4-amino-4-deoxy-L-arabinose transferase-like glycosyltransferase